MKKAFEFSGEFSRAPPFLAAVLGQRHFFPAAHPAE
jgi:hypothetical protein